MTGSAAALLQQQAVGEEPILVRWRGSPNFWMGRAGHKPVAIVLHTAGGFFESTADWFADPASGVSAHFGVSLAGLVDWYVELEDTAWGNGKLELGNSWPGTPGVNPNIESLSIETEDRRLPDTEPVTSAQLASTVSVCRLIMRAFPDIRYLVRHAAISPLSRTCPGRRWAGLFGWLAAELGLEAV